MADRFAWPALAPTAGSACPTGQTSEGVWGSAKRSGASPSRGGRRLPDNPQGILRIQLVKKGFDKPVDGEASSPATATLTSFC